MRAAALALLLVTTPALAAPDAPVLCLTAAELALVDDMLERQHQAVADLAKRNEVLEAETRRQASSSFTPVAIALAVGAVLGAGATLLLIR